MAETKEKATKKRAPAKPKAAGIKKSAAKKADGVTETKLAVSIPTHDEIAFLALQYWEQRGRAHGQHEQDWLRAEEELMKMAS